MSRKRSWLSTDYSCSMRNLACCKNPHALKSHGLVYPNRIQGWNGLGKVRSR